MSVIITGMDMPENCMRCPMDYKTWGDTYNCRIKFREISRNKYEDSVERHKDCPLKSVDGLVEELTEYGNCQCDAWDNSIIQGAIEIIEEYCEVEE